LDLTFKNGKKYTKTGIALQRGLTGSQEGHEEVDKVLLPIRVEGKKKRNKKTKSHQHSGFPNGPPLQY
jgi:hypothetical protein